MSNGRWNNDNVSLPDVDNNWNAKVRINAAISLIVLVVVIVVAVSAVM